MTESLDFIGVSFTFDSLATPIIQNLTARFPRGFTGIVGANGVGKSTLLALATGLLTPQSGQIHRPRHALYCPQRTDAPPDHLADLLTTDDAHAGALRSRLGIQSDHLTRWPTLSHGERKRAQIATALWLQPDALAIDEPSNHIDTPTRDLLLAELKNYRGIGLLVSHDRTLLDTLCRQCLFLESGHATLRPGGYTQGLAQAQANNDRARALRDQAKSNLKRLQAEESKRREITAKEHKTRSKHGLAPKDFDSRGRINLARVTDSKSGAPLRQLQGRIDQSESRLDGIHVKKETRLSLWLPESKSRMDALLRLSAGQIPLTGCPGSNSDQTHDCSDLSPALASARTLSFPDLTLKPDSRTAVTGPNGSGKSTLIRHILTELLIPRDKTLYIPQEIPAQHAQSLLKTIHTLPHEKLTRLLNVISQLGSDPKRILQTQNPSPGETRKLLLALGVAQAANLIIMDEPTNHLDLPSIQCLESALAESPCALVLVSHDQHFLQRTTYTTWHIQPIDKHQNTQLIITQAPTA
jgi:macrolide transport system ATP-binding/permease protein